MPKAIRIMGKPYRIVLVLLWMNLFTGINWTLGQAIRFKHYAVKEGISQSEIKCIFQDTEGYMWFGTQNGLNKFDGYSFEKYFFDPTDTTTLSNAWIFGITEDQFGNLWMGTKEGVNRFDKRTGAFSRINHQLANPVVNDNFVYGITSDESNIYINTPPALSIINYKTGELTTYNNSLDYDGALHDMSIPIMKSKEGLIWIGSHSGLSHFDPKEKIFTNFRSNETDPNTISNDNITALCEDQDGNIWIGTEDGLNLFNQRTKIITRFRHKPNTTNSLSHNFIRTIIQDHTGAYWVGTEQGGLNRMTFDYKTGAAHFTHYRSGTDHVNFIGHDIVHSLYEDKSNNLWIGTIAGIDRTDLKKKHFRSYKKTDTPNSIDLLDNIIASVYQDDENRIWIGNWGKGLNIYEPGTEKVVHYSSLFLGKHHIPNNHAHVIFRDSKGRIWLGTRDGVCIFDKRTETFIPAHEYFNTGNFDHFNNNRVYCIIEDHTGLIWIGTGNGIFILDTDAKKTTNLRAGDDPTVNISSNLVYSLLEDEDKQIWIATSNGLDRYVPTENRIFHYRNHPESSNTLCDNYCISLCEDLKNNIWIGTSSGVNRFNKTDSIFSHYSISNGLPSNIVYDIIEDDNRNLWFSTGNGLAMFNTKTGILKPYSIEDELRGMEFNIKAVYKSKDGEMFFGGMDGLISFYPDSLQSNRYIPPVVITSVVKEKDGEKQSLNVYSEEVLLTHRDYSFTIEFSALDYTNPESNQYAYRMKGLSNQWIDLGNRRFVPFTNLPAGKYTFQVKGSNNDGIWNETGISIKMVILPPWWKSNYAYASYLIVLMLSIFSYIKLRERKLIQEKNVLEKKVALRTAEIALQKEKVEESEEKLKSTITSLDDLVFVLDQKGIIREFYNPSKQDTLYLLPELSIDKHFEEVGLPCFAVSQLNRVFEKLRHTDVFQEFDYSIEKAGQQFWFNAKVSPRRNSKGKLSGITIVARDITERKRAEKQLEKQKNALKELNATKDKFFSILAHDLKNPFTSLYSLSELISTNYKDLEDEDKIMVLEKIYKSAQLIYNLLENLLTWSKSQGGNIDYQPNEFNLSKIIEMNLNLHQVPAEKKGILLSSDMNDNVTVFGDRDMTNTVIRNLVNNAIKFSGKGGTVHINLTEQDHFVEVVVKDQGVGISDENLKKLFRIDVKFKSEGTAGEKGTGLGLVLCKEFVEKNGGTIWCESKVGVGTAFHFTLPKEKP